MGRRRFIALGAAFLFVFPAGAKDWQGVMLPDQPTQFIFGYGSLINMASRNATVGKMIPAIPVRVSAAFGYIRAWDDRSIVRIYRAWASQARRKRKSVDDQWRPLPGRGRRHGQIRRPRAGLQAGRSAARRDRARILAAIACDRQIWVYIPVKADGEPGVGLPVASAEFPLLESYIDVVVEGALEYGDDFARELIETTSEWSNYWLNDRELARRPWVYNPASSQVDALLMENSEAAAKLKWRLFPEPYAIHWAADKAQ